MVRYDVWQNDSKIILRMISQALDDSSSNFSVRLSDGVELAWEISENKGGVVFAEDGFDQHVSSKTPAQLSFFYKEKFYRAYFSLIPGVYIYAFPEIILESIPRQDGVLIFGYAVSRQISIKTEYSTDRINYSFKEIKDTVSKAIEDHLGQLTSQNFQAQYYLFKKKHISIVGRMVRQYGRAFIIPDTFNLTLTGDNSLSYKDYVDYFFKLSSDKKRILKKLDRIKKSYTARGIRAEAILPVIYNKAVIGQIKVHNGSRPFLANDMLVMRRVAQEISNKIKDAVPFKVTLSTGHILEYSDARGFIWLADNVNGREIFQLDQSIHLEITKDNLIICNLLARVKSIKELDNAGLFLINAELVPQKGNKDQEAFLQLINDIQNFRETTVL